MKVLGIPVHDIKLGSTRTRYYYMLKYLPQGWTFERYAPGADGDVLYIQKCEHAQVWAAVKDCKNRGIPIVYDRDDFDKPWNKEHTRIMNAADAVTIISKGLLEHVKQHTTTPLFHVMDGFDYDIQRDERIVIRPRIKNVITYGRHANIEEAANYYKYVKVGKAYVCDRPISQMGSAKYIQWHLRKFKNKMARYDVAIIVHAETHRKQFKDIGRVMVAMAMGMPVISTRSIEADRVFEEIGHTELLVKKPKDVSRALSVIKDSLTRQRISNVMWEYAWKNWRPDQASAQMAKVFERVINDSKGFAQTTV